MNARQTDNNGPQETLKNNYMAHGNAPPPISDPQIDLNADVKNARAGAVNKSTRGNNLKELQLQALSFPVKDRVQSAKSSSTH